MTYQYIFVGGLAPGTLLPWSEHRFGTKREVTPFSFHSLIGPFPLVVGFASIIPNIEHNTVSHLTVWTFEMAPCYLS